MMKRRIVEFLVLLMVAIGASPLGAAVWQWSTTAGSNATADPTINWSEGMSPSSVNDSARAMMAGIAAWRRDIHGYNQTAGTSTAYTFTSNQGFGSASDLNGAEFALYFHVANGVNATLNIDGIGAFPLRIDTATALPAGALGPGSGIMNATLVFSQSTGGFIVQNYFNNVYNIPLGGLLPSTLPTAPNANFIVPNGQCISTTTYATYWAALGSPASGSCPGGQFAVIDMRGRNPTALDNIGGVAANILTSASTGCGTAFTTMGAKCANGTEGRSLLLANLPPITSSGSNSISVGSAGNQIPVGPAGTLINDGFTGGAGQYIPRSPTLAGWTFVGSLTSTQTITVTSTGTTTTPVSTVNPNIGLYYYLRVI